MAVLIEQFVENVTSSGLVSKDDVNASIESLPSAQRGDARALARSLIDSGLLTRFQAKSLYRGRAAGLVVGEYLLLERIGKGGMGEVFKARHRHLDRVVALKLLARELAGQTEFVSRFHREMRAVAKLSHPNIVQAYDADQSRGRLYLAMEFVTGTDLGNVLKSQGSISVSQAVHYVLQAAAGLQYAHGQGIVHRDIKPGNLMLDHRGTVRILDFGLAAFEQQGNASTQLTRTGDVMGSVDFMSPEQLTSTREADQRSDVYSLGCVLYVLLTAKPMFSGASVMTKLAGHMQGEIPSLQAQLTGEFGDLDGVFQRMVAKAPEDRYQSMAEVIEALSPFAETTETVPPAARRSTAADARQPAGEWAAGTVSAGEFNVATPPATIRPRARTRSGRRKAQRRQRMARWLTIGLLAGVVALIAGVMGWQRFPGPGPDDDSPVVAAGDDAPPAPGRDDEPSAALAPADVVPLIPEEPVVRVFVLAGQSNMGGPAPLTALKELVQSPEHVAEFEHLLTPDGDWTARDDVWIRSITHQREKLGALSTAYGERDDSFGPELGFGHVVGNAIDDPVLIIKVTDGAMSLGEEGRPPSSGGGGGPYYHRLVKLVDDTLPNLATLFPDLPTSRYEIAGFVWFQGWNDLLVAARVAEYEDNLSNLIRDLRAAWNAPQMAVVIGELGQIGEIDPETMNDSGIRHLQMRAAQRSVAELPEFQGTVACAGTAQFVEELPPKYGFLYGGDAEIFYRIGDEFGNVMLSLLNESDGGEVAKSDGDARR